MEKKNQPAWFRIYRHQGALIESVPDQAIGRALKGAMHYFETGEFPALSELEMAIFGTFRRSIDESVADYNLRVENGKRGGRPAKQK